MDRRKNSKRPRVAFRFPRDPGEIRERVDTVYRLLKKGKLDGLEDDGSWSVSIHSLAEYEAEHGGTAAKMKTKAAATNSWQCKLPV